MNAAVRLMLMNSARNASHSSRHNDPDDDRYIATSLVDDLWSNRKGTIGLLVLNILLMAATAAFCLKDITRAQIQILMVIAVITNGLAVGFYRLYLSGALKYLCWHWPDALEDLSGEEITHRYRRACIFGVLSVLLGLADTILLTRMEYQLYHPDLLRMPIIPMVLLAGVWLIAAAQIIRVLLSANNVRRTSKWWAEERETDPGLSFADYAHTPIE